MTRWRAVPGCASSSWPRASRPSSLPRKRGWRNIPVDQVAALRLEDLGVPVRWEQEPERGPQSAAGQLKSRAIDVAGAAALGLARKFLDPRMLPSLDQAEAYDQGTENLTGGWLDRMMEYNIVTARDARLASALDAIHRDHAGDEMTVAVVFGAGHMPAISGHLCGKLGYIAASGEWLTVAHARS
jgi:hypothetical protein